MFQCIVSYSFNDLLASGTSRASTYETTAIPAQQFSPRLLTPKNNREDSARPDGLNWPTKKYCLKQLLPLPETWVPYLANSTCSSLYVSKTSTTLMKIGDWTGTNVHVVLAAGELAWAAGAELEDFSQIIIQPLDIHEAPPSSSSSCSFLSPQPPSVPW